MNENIEKEVKFSRNRFDRYTMPEADSDGQGQRLSLLLMK